MGRESTNHNPEAPTGRPPVLDLRSRPDERAKLAAALAAARFPARRDELIADAEESFASEVVMSQLRQLPDDREFPTVQSVWEALSGEVEARRC